MPDWEKVIKDLEFCVNGHFKVELSLATKILALLKEQGAIIEQLNQFVNGFSRDAMPVVRCKDCVYGMMFKNVKDEQRFECVSPTHNGTYVEAHDPDWFCADGKRKEGR